MRHDEPNFTVISHCTNLHVSTDNVMWYEWNSSPKIHFLICVCIFSTTKYTQKWPDIYSQSFMFETKDLNVLWIILTHVEESEANIRQIIHVWIHYNFGLVVYSSYNPKRSLWIAICDCSKPSLFVMSKQWQQLTVT